MSSTPSPSRVERVRAIREALVVQQGLITSYERIIADGGDKGEANLKQQIAELESRAARVRATLESYQAERAEAPTRLASARAELTRLSARLRELEVEPKVDKLETLVEKAIALAIAEGKTSITIGSTTIDLAAMIAAAGAAGGGK